ncbi:pentatricopeptide repeat-containing protein At5g57250, mitochondrial [Telopea speciosissima]|uniref:pentatricopeptide repeat-containing protein At5g57250, mitochondrial n=1 Tax=Telopea speciosissima TaxID=54955 RepID=UPI001CC4DA3A|nr:pentatricopeptide repeat-containing protein At5g57250, mitochondrial [Telopea speciosissima]
MLSMKEGFANLIRLSSTFFPNRLLIQNLTMTTSTILAKNFSSSSPRNLPEIPTLQNLLKRGFSPTLESFNQFLEFLSENQRFKSVLHLFSQMKLNKISGNSGTHSIVVRALLEDRRFEEAEIFVIQLGKEGFHSRNGIWDSLIQSLCVAGKNPEKAFALLRDCLRNHGSLPTFSTFSSLIHSFSSLGKMDRAIEVLEMMTDEKIGHPVDNSICSSIISGFCRIGNPELALKFYEKVEKIETFRPNVVTYTALVSSLCIEGRVKEVSDLVCRMEKEGIVLDAVFYSSWICGFFSEGVLQEAFQKHKLMVESGIKPDIVSYTILIDGFSKEGNVEKAVGFLNEMKKVGVEPNLVTYTAVVRGFCQKGKLDEAVSVFRKLEELGIVADEVMYSTLIDAFCRKADFDQVFSLLDEMEKKGIITGIVTYNTVINGLSKVGRTCEADEISKCISGDNFTYSTLLHGYIEEKNVEGVLKTKMRLEEAGVKMDGVMCNVLIKALFMTGLVEDAYMIFKEMLEMGWHADSVTYYTMIDGYCKVGRINEALEIFDAYRTSLFPDVVCYNCIIRGLCENGMLDMAIEVFTELIEKGLPPSKATYMMVIRSLFKQGNGQGVLNFLYGIQKLEPEIYGDVCSDAVHFLCKRGCAESAFDVYMMLKSKNFGVTSICYYSILKGLITKGNNWLQPVMMNAYLKDYGWSEFRFCKILVRYLCKKDVILALRFLDTMKKKDMCVLDPFPVVETLVEQGRITDAYKLILEVGDQTLLNVVAYSIVIDGLCKSGYLNRALDLCDTMKKKGIAPNIVTYNSVIYGLCQQGCLIEALRLFDSLEKVNLVPTDITYGTLISALSKEGFLLDAKQLLERMVLNGFIPNTRVYNSLIDGYCKLGSMEKALELLLDLEKSCHQPDAFTVSAVINGCCCKGDMEGALGFYLDYKRKGVLPDFIGFIYLLKGLLAKGRMEEARNILREMLQVQSVVELIDRAAAEIETESIGNILVFLCEQGSIREAISVLNEVGSLVYPFGRRSGAIGGSQKLEKPHKDLFDNVVAESLTSLCTTDLDLELLEGKGNGVADNLVTKHLFFDFDAYYALVASLCSKGEPQKANRVAKEMILYSQKGC